MELYEANQILHTVKAAITADGYKLPSSAETNGLLFLLGKTDLDKCITPTLKHARTADTASAAYDRAYKQLCFFRALETFTRNNMSDHVTATSIMLLHKTLCGDLDVNAGKLRTKELLTDGNAHTDPKYISGSLKSIIAKMNEIGSAPETAKEDFAGYLSHYMRELIILHPFERGSEFTVRIFIMLFCRLKSFALMFFRTTPAVIKNAEMSALAADDITPLYKLFAQCLSYDHKPAAPQRSAPRTRREIAKNLCRPPRSEAPSQLAANAPEQKKKLKQNGLSDDEVLKRAIRLQQKISKLNEQLAELMRPLENNGDDK